MKVERICKFCGKTFYIAQGHVKHGRGIFCSRECVIKSHAKSCSVDGCNSQYYARGFCRKHYEQIPEVKARQELRQKDYAKRKKEKIRTRNKAWSENLKIETFSHYSNGDIHCAHCGYSDIRALELDHINGDGNIHRRKLSGRSYSGGGTVTYLDLKKKGFPNGYQVLCRNCNWIKYIENVR